jgi:AraC-like DNA-binding protein
MLMNALRRARQLVHEGQQLAVSPPFAYFLSFDPKIDDFRNEIEPLENFALLDDFDIMSALKQWMTHTDKLLAYLSKSIVNRQLFKAEIQNDPFDPAYTDTIKNHISDAFGGSQQVLEYLFIEGSTSNHAYNPGQAHINILSRDGRVSDISESLDLLSISTLSKPFTKHFICYPKHLG